MSAPRTIEELRQWAADLNLPLDRMRTYIGEDVRSPRCYGVYQDIYTGDFVTYKNKADGTRSIRYQGPDEAKAVHELYLKMKERVAAQKSARASVPIRAGRKRRGPVFTVVLGLLISTLMAPVLISFLFLSFRFSDGYKKSQLPYAQSGYYSMDDRVYYHRGGGDWYYYDRYGWEPYLPDKTWSLFEDYLDYYAGYEYYDYDFDEWYEDYSESQSSGYDDDDDYDYSWDSDWDWDDSYDDWDSDW